MRFAFICTVIVVRFKCDFRALFLRFSSFVTFLNLLFCIFCSNVLDIGILESRALYLIYNYLFAVSVSQISF